MSGWVESWTDNKMFKLAEEKRRQQAVVKKFIADHPEYDPQNDDNNKLLVDYIEGSKRPFTTETIEWAYKQCKVFLETKKKNFYQKISTALTNQSTASVSLPVEGDPKPEVAGGYSYTSIKMLGKDYKLPYYYDADVGEVTEQLNAVAAAIDAAFEAKLPDIDDSPAPKYDTEIAPTKTERRIKDDDD